LVWRPSAAFLRAVAGWLGRALFFDGKSRVDAVADKIKTRFGQATLRRSSTLGRNGGRSIPAHL
jgi:hypothetical protein